MFFTADKAILSLISRADAADNIAALKKYRYRKCSNLNQPSCIALAVVSIFSHPARARAQMSVRLSARVSVCTYSYTRAQALHFTLPLDWYEVISTAEIVKNRERGET